VANSASTIAAAAFPARPDGRAPPVSSPESMRSSSARFLASTMRVPSTTIMPRTRNV
jgi:hypothetical protein